MFKAMIMSIHVKINIVSPEDWKKLIYKFLGVTMMPNASYCMMTNNDLPLGI